METIKGYIEKIVYRNSENGYTVLQLSVFQDGSEEEEITCVGHFAGVDEGEFIEVSGDYGMHSVYGDQFTARSYSVKIPEDIESIRKYLGAGSIKGVGETMADRIVRKFGLETFEIMEKQPERLAEVKGISIRKAMDIADQLEEKRDLRQAMIFLQKYGISLNLAVRIYEQYGCELYTIIRDNPFKMADEITGIGFKAADEIAKKAGILPDSHYRIKSGILYVLQQASSNGDVYLPMEEVALRAGQLLDVESAEFEKNIMDLVLDRKLMVRDEDRKTYVSHYYYTELNCAKMLQDLALCKIMKNKKTDNEIEEIERESGIILDELQIQAIKEAAQSGFLVVTGGPGTGKTTTINAIIRFFMKTNCEILLGAPTGRAAKRMTEATGLEAQTIHRLLEISGMPSDSQYGARFERNEENPLEADVVIIDEASMVDIFLMHALLKAITPGTRLILVGDVNQLPSVGPGNVLHDILECGCFNVVRLTKIFRQATESDIVLNAHKINHGKRIDLKKPSRDFLFIDRGDADRIISAMITLITKKLPEYVGCDAKDIQVITPMRKGLLGVERLNKILREFLNPKDGSKREKEFQGIVFREGDKVMQIKNNYQLEWEAKNAYGVAAKKGTGIFNGDMGIIRTVNSYAEIMEVEFDEGRIIEYSFRNLDELEPAYAITVHKAQGSEYPAVIFPVLSGPRMLMTRNILYTAVTRARKCVCLLGSEETIWQMTDNKNEQVRYSGLKERLREFGSDAGVL